MALPRHSTPSRVGVYTITPHSAAPSILEAYNSLPAIVRERLAGYAPPLCDECREKALGHAWAVVAVAALAETITKTTTQVSGQLKTLENLAKSMLPLAMRR